MKSIRYEEYKNRVNLSLTPTAIDGLDSLAHDLGLSRSEVVERVGRGDLPVSLQKEDRRLLGELFANW